MIRNFVFHCFVFFFTFFYDVCILLYRPGQIVGDYDKDNNNIEIEFVHAGMVSAMEEKAKQMQNIIQTCQAPVVNTKTKTKTKLKGDKTIKLSKGEQQGPGEQS